MFRRNTESGRSGTSVDDQLPKQGGKGRPTPTRKEAEEARKARVRGSKDKKAATKTLREGRASQNRRIREGMKAGDERYLPARDKGPVKRFIRDYVDSHLCFTEFLLPLLIVIMLLGQAKSDFAVALSGDLWTVTFVLTVIDLSWLIYRVRKAIRAKFPDKSLKGTTSYTILRVLQLRFMRTPKAQVGLGGKPKK